MNRISFLFFILLTSFAYQSFSQVINNFAGTWEGTLKVGVDLRIVFHIKEDGKGNLISTADSPDQSAFGMACDSTTASENELTIIMKALKATYSGKLKNDSLIEGTFTQGAELPLALKKVDKPAERKRPQTLKAPFPYKSEDVIYDTKDKSLQLGATLTIPEGKGPFPAALLITGSGPQNRDEDIMGHKPFAVISDYLTRKGFIVLRVDDRGVGKSTGDFGNATSADFANDASSSIDYLLTRPEANKKKMGLIGHSEGGMIAPMVATQRKDIDFIVLLAGPGVKIIDLMTEQNVAILRSANISKEATEAYLPLYKETISQIVNAPDTATAYKTADVLLQKWIVQTNEKLITELGMNDRKAQHTMLSMLSNQLSTPWFKYFLAFDPQPYLQKLDCKVLAINGSKDIQVIASQNLPGIEASLKKSKSKIYEIKELPGLNHLFQTCNKCTLQEYAELEETFSPVALQLVGDWMIKNVK